MNTSKKIDVSKSSLVSLKAELSRKQEEVSKAKASGSGFIHPVARPKKETVLTKKNRGVEQRDERDAEERKVEEDAHKKSRAVLEAKSRLYEQLYGASSRSNPDRDRRFLVDFQRKAAESEGRSAPDSSPDVEEHHDSDEYDTNVDPEDDWVDYTDCLGRTRRCLRRDMDFVKDKDAQLAKTLNKLPEGEAGETNMLLNDLRLQQLRQKWEQQEEELKERKDIHYQNVLFDEARAHGVGYYAFSHEEIERASQQEALNEQRQETQRQQQLARELRERREKQLQARLKAARARNRVRLGLPPEEDEPQPGPSAEDQAATTEDEAAVGKADEEEEAEAKTTEAAPKADHVRPWDMGKDGVIYFPKIHFEPMSQGEWVEKNRDERIEEFAPAYGNEEEQPSSAKPSPWNVNVNMQQSMSFFSSKQAKPGESGDMAMSQEEGVQMNQDERPPEFAPVYGNEQQQPSFARPKPWNMKRQPSTSFFSTKKAKPGEFTEIAMSQEERVQKKREERPQEFAPVYGNVEEHTPSARPGQWNVNRKPSTLFFTSKKVKPGDSSNMAMSQDERVQKKREERPQEFAPVYGTEGEHVSSDRPGPWIVDRQPSTLLFPSIKAKPGEPTDMGASSSKRISHLLGERVVPQPVVPMKRTKIQNELSGEDSSSSDEDTRGLGVEIGPPPPHEYMMSSPMLPKRSSSVPKSEIEKSIEIGLAKLRREYEEKRRRGIEKQGGIYDFLPK